MTTGPATPERARVPVGYAGVCFDVDGVLVRGTDPIAHAADAVGRVRAAGAGVAFVTNNATRTPEAVAQVLRDAGVDASGHEVCTAAQAAAALVQAGTRCLVIGEEGLHRALADRGAVQVVGPAEAEAVVVGLDRSLTWDDLRRATQALRGGARFVATNADATFPSPDGLVPGNGAIVAALVTASSRAPEIAGKPHAPLFTLASELLPPGDRLMVGDRSDTDLDGARARGWETACVLTGVTSAAQARALDPPPTYVLDDLRGLYPEGERPDGPA